ncbi:uncharacterized protein TNCV_1647461 [Trichonephila clavipes]|nr:uncharacterized protein TNCV_1647461 [Trichonephila clavipes]
MHDGTQAHFLIVVRNQLHTIYPGRSIGIGGSVACPLRSLDLNPLNFFFWVYQKSLVYEKPVDTVKDVMARIVVASADIASTPGLFKRFRQSFVRRCRLCYYAADAASTSNNYCDNYLSLYFLRRLMTHRTYCKHTLC